MSKYAFEYVTFDELKSMDALILSTMELEKANYDNFIYLNEKAYIEIISFMSDTRRDEIKYYDKIKFLLEKLSCHNRNYDIKINVKNRELFRQSDILNNIPKNIKLIIKNDFHDYDVSSYKKEEEKLEKLVSPIRMANLSPLEKYLAVYNIVKMFKKYNENKEHKEQARDMRYILDDDNHYIVCVGFANLLYDLLNRVGINNIKISVDVDVSYDKGFTLEDKMVSLAGHSRNLVKIDDDKYNIHGFYLADSTMDNFMDYDVYQSALITFDHLKEARRLEKINNYDLLLDYHDKNDFCKKIELYLRNRAQELRGNKKYLDQSNLISLYTKLFKDVMGILKSFDNDKYDEFYNKYNKSFENYNLEEMEKVLPKMMDEYANYIIPLSNQEIKMETILEAAKKGKIIVNGYDDKKIKKWEETTNEDNFKVKDYFYPYKYDINSKTL